MAHAKLIPLDRPEVAPYPLSDRLRSQLVYFMADSDAPGIPELGEDEFWFDGEDVTRWIMEGVFYLVSPLDTENMTEVELSEEQDALLNWLDRNQVRHVRVDD